MMAGIMSNTCMPSFMILKTAKNLLSLSCNKTFKRKSAVHMTLVAGVGDVCCETSDPYSILQISHEVWHVRNLSARDTRLITTLNRKFDYVIAVS